MMIDIERVGEIIAQIAEDEILSRHGKLHQTQISTKSGPHDFVTEADIAAEERLEKALKEVLPEAGFIGEEGVARDGSILSVLEHDTGSYWIVDPLDGTRNFIEGRDEFGSVVALIRQGEIVGAWIYGVLERKIAMASKGDGAFWDGTMLGPIIGRTDLTKDSAFKDLNGYRAIGALGAEHARLGKTLLEDFNTDPARCSAYAYINMARGLRDFGLFARLNVWDHAAGVLLLSEIGGQAKFVGTHAHYEPRQSIGQPMLVAPSPDVWDAVEAKLLAD